MVFGCRIDEELYFPFGVLALYALLLMALTGIMYLVTGNSEYYGMFNGFAVSSVVLGIVSYKLYRDYRCCYETIKAG